MKRLDIQFFCITVLMIMGFSSCNDKNYRMVTQINRDSSISREIYAHGDSAFLAGDLSHNPYLFNLDGWKITKFNPEEKNTSFGSGEKFNVKITRKFRNITDVSSGLNFDEAFHSFVVPEESVKKRFKWFYTTYTYTGNYKKLDLSKMPVSIDKYMDENEQKLWFQGMTEGCDGMNGMELKGELDNMETRFFTWLSRNIYEVSFSTIQHFIRETPGFPYTVSQLAEIKDSLFRVNSVDLENKDYQIVDVCKMLDQYFITARFSDLYKGKKNVIDEFYDKNYGWGDDLFTTAIEFKLIIPGEIINTNTRLAKQDTLIWKVDGIRLVADDYQLFAESRVENKWAFIVTFTVTLGLICFVVIINVRKKKNNLTRFRL